MAHGSKEDGSEDTANPANTNPLATRPNALGTTPGTGATLATEDDRDPAPAPACYYSSQTSQNGRASR